MPPFCTRRIVDWYAFNATPLPTPRPVHRLPLGRRLCVQEYFLNTSYVQRWIQSGKYHFSVKADVLWVSYSPYPASCTGKKTSTLRTSSTLFCCPIFAEKPFFSFFLLVCSAKGYRTFSIHHFASLFLSSCLPENFSFFSYRYKKLGALAFDD